MSGRQQALNLGGKPQSTIVQSRQVTSAVGVIGIPRYHGVLWSVAFHRLLLGILGGIEIELASPPRDLYPIVIARFVRSV